MSKERHAHFSAEAAARYGVAVYRGVSGKLAPVTLVSDSSEHGTGWKDMRYLGRVVEFLGRIECGEMRTGRDCDEHERDNPNPESLHDGLRRLGATDMRGLPDVKGRPVLKGRGRGTAIDDEFIKSLKEEMGKLLGAKKKDA